MRRDAKQQKISTSKLNTALKQLKKRRDSYLASVNKRYRKEVNRINILTYDSYLTSHEVVKKRFANLRKEFKKVKK